MSTHECCVSKESSDFDIRGTLSCSNETYNDFEPARKDNPPDSDSSESTLKKSDDIVDDVWREFQWEVLCTDDCCKIPEVFSYTDLELTEEEQGGFLTDRIIASCSSYIKRNPLTKRYTIIKVNLRQKNLNDISILFEHHFLQYVDLSFNELTDVSALNGLTFLVYLDVSHNKLTELLNIDTPYNLTYTNWSYNEIERINDLAEFWTLKELVVSNNLIEKIEGLESLKYLRNLDLSFNKIRRIENLSNLNIQWLNLQNNEIDSFEHGKSLGFHTMTYLSHVDLGFNQLDTLLLFENALSVQNIIFQANCFEHLVEISYLGPLPYLVSVDFSENPVTQQNNYEAICFCTMTKLEYHDQKEVIRKDKIDIQVDHNPGIETKSAQVSSNLTGLKYLTEQKLGLNIIPVDQPLQPLILLVGVEGSKCYELNTKYIENNSDIVTRILKHMTRLPQPGGTSDHHIVDKIEFDELLCNGEFLTMSSLMDEYCGITYDEFWKASAEDKVMLAEVNLEEALALRSRSLNPIMVLCMPKCKNNHLLLLKELYQTSLLSLRNPEGAVNIKPRENTNASDISQPDDITSEPNASRVFDDNNSNIDITDSDHGTVTNSVLSKRDSIDVSLISLYTEFGSKDFFSEEVENPKNPSLCTPILSSDVDDLAGDFYKYVLNMREQYLKFHADNPGFFYETVFTDDINEALDKLDNIINDAIDNEEYSKPTFSLFKDEVYDKIIEKKLDKYQTEIHRSMRNTPDC